MIFALGGALGACRDVAVPPAAPTDQVVARHVTAVPEGPDDAAWAEVAAHRANLVPQDMVEPRLLAASTPQMHVQALYDADRIAFRIAWDDATRDDLPGIGRFSDAVAVQVPASTGPNVPAPQMGEPGGMVEISYWRAFWQSAVDGRPDSIKALYPGAAVDLYPFDAPPLVPGSPEQLAMAKRYAPARAAGNDAASPRARAVEDLVAVGPGSLAPAPTAVSAGRGVRTGTAGSAAAAKVVPSAQAQQPASAPTADAATGASTDQGSVGTGWVVVLSRPLPRDVNTNHPGQVAFAVWDGARKEVGARKMRTPWLPLTLGERP